MTASGDHESLGYLTQDVHGAWEQMTAAVRLGDREAYEGARRRFLEGEAKVYAMLDFVESEQRD